MRGLGHPTFDDDLGCGEVLDRRLRPDRDRPLAVAVSGGGDSTALALIARDWARAHGRPLLILTVDHGLRPQSRDWAQACADLAARLGARFQALDWTGEKPATGLPAAARDARHRLIANAARAAGARVVLMGHTAGDVAEAQAMRRAGSTTPSPREWAPSPVWPEGRGLFVLRPLLGVGREPIRAWLRSRGETWIDDPANEDLRFARARARTALKHGASEPPAPPTSRPAELAREVRGDPSGMLAIARRALAWPEAEALLSAACLSASGTCRPPRGHRAAHLVDRLRGGEVFSSSLAGARVEADVAEVRILREPGEMVRRGLPPLVLRPGRSAVWDGRFEIVADRDLVILPLAGLTARLPPAQRLSLAALPPSARQGLPVAVEDERVNLAAATPGVEAVSLAHDRLLAACGAVDREPV